MLKVVGETLEVGETNDEYRKRTEERKECFLEKRLHGKFMRDIREVVNARSWQWLRAEYLAKGNEGFVFKAQEQALRTRFFRASIEKEDVDPKCRMCGSEVESVGYLASGCSGLAQKEYRRRHDRLGLRVYWELCRKYDVKCADVWYKEVPDDVRSRLMEGSRSGGIEVLRQHRRWNIIVHMLLCWIMLLSRGLC